MHCLNNIQIERQVTCHKPIKLELHAFCDASEQAYGACVYLCSTNTDGQRFSNLLRAKSKVAPLKKITLPRLELQAAVFLTRLVSTVRQTLNVKIDNETYYSDSTVVLSWCQLHPSRLKTYVANRVVRHVRHVRSKFNAADVISRGINREHLAKLNLWWHGPSFLLDSSINSQIFDT